MIQNFLHISSKSRTYLDEQVPVQKTTNMNSIARFTLENFTEISPLEKAIIISHLLRAKTQNTWNEPMDCVTNEVRSALEDIVNDPNKILTFDDALSLHDVKSAVITLIEKEILEKITLVLFNSIKLRPPSDDHTVLTEKFVLSLVGKSGFTPQKQQ